MRDQPLAGNLPPEGLRIARTVTPLKLSTARMVLFWFSYLTNAKPLDLPVSLSLTRCRSSICWDYHSHTVSSIRDMSCSQCPQHQRVTYLSPLAHDADHIAFSKLKRHVAHIDPSAVLVLVVPRPRCDAPRELLLIEALDLPNDVHRGGEVVGPSSLSCPEQHQRSETAVESFSRNIILNQGRSTANTWSPPVMRPAEGRSASRSTRFVWATTRIHYIIYVLTSITLCAVASQGRREDLQADSKTWPTLTCGSTPQW